MNELTEHLTHLALLLHHPLRHLALELTNDCNLACWYCLGKRRTVGYMDKALFKRLVDEVPKSCKTLSLSFGGESILHPNFTELLEYAHTHTDAELFVYTNGFANYPWREYLHLVMNPKPPEFIITSGMKWYSKPDTKPFHTAFCSQLYGYMAVLWNGDVTLCCADIGGVRVVGNVVDHSVSEVWHSSCYNRLRLAGFCRGCEVYPYLK